MAPTAEGGGEARPLGRLTHTMGWRLATPLNSPVKKFRTKIIWPRASRPNKKKGGGQANQMNTSLSPGRMNRGSVKYVRAPYRSSTKKKNEGEGYGRPVSMGIVIGPIHL